MSKPLTITLNDNSTITYFNPALVIDGIGDYGEPEVRIIGRPDADGNVYSSKQPEKEPQSFCTEECGLEVKN